MTQLTYIEPADLGEADRALKSKHRSMWASGNYPAVVTDLLSRAASAVRVGVTGR
jgi:hypothetical protein